MIDLIEGAFLALILLLCCMALVALAMQVLAFARALRRPKPTYVKKRYQPGVTSWQQSETQRVPRVPHG